MLRQTVLNDTSSSNERAKCNIYIHFNEEIIFKRKKMKNNLAQQDSLTRAKRLVGRTALGRQWREHGSAAVPSSGRKCSHAVGPPAACEPNARRCRRRKQPSPARNTREQQKDSCLKIRAWQLEGPPNQKPNVWMFS